MRATKAQKIEASELFISWTQAGVPDLITGYEAYALTNGLVGKQKSSTPHRLVDVAVKYAVKKSKRGGEQ